jgi:alcohol dehydrogenase (cytochrome c)
MIAVNVTNGKMVWATPFIDYGTVLNVRVPDTHD